MADLGKQYLEEIRPALMKEFGYKNIMQVPKIEKIVINVGVGRESADNPKAVDAAVNDIMMITGQKPIVTRAQVNCRL